MTPLEPTPWRREFPLPPETLYFNHAGVAPIPLRTAQTIAKIAEITCQLGAIRYPELMAIHEAARETCARLLGVASERLAFVPNTSEGLSYAALGVDWQAGDEIITTDQEFPSNLVVWADVARRHGVTLHRVPSRTDGGVDVTTLLNRITPRTRVVTVSWVQFGTGAVVDVARLGAALRPTDTLLVVDGIQGLGLLPMTMDDWGIDLLAADAHKWLLGPEGCGVCGFSDKALTLIQPRVLGWHSLVNAGEYHDPIMTWRPGARRFEPGSPNLIGAVAMGESAGLLLEVGIDQVHERVRCFMAGLVAGLTELGCRLHTPLNAVGLPGAGILLFTHPGVETALLHQRLKARGVLHVQRQAGLRLSPHFYQDLNDLEGFLAILGDELALLSPRP